ncbi:hypothetical protein LCGC14_0447810 [marine sediment metagenome]|uniref:Uncharacterized protein n=1 Tax=marine sediment metagenome TaxID=412755 RepID=A0A0F9V5I1_9ZZZZ
MSKIQNMSVGAYDVGCRTKRVFFRPATPTDTVRVGQAVCYNSDIVGDHKERTSAPSQLGGDSFTTYAEGVQSYTGRLFIVEQPTEGANLVHFAGIVKSLGEKAGGDGDFIEIFQLTEGAIVPVWTDANCVINQTVLGVADGAYTLSQDTGDGDPLGIGVAVETIDRSTPGLCWMRMYAAPGIGGNSLFLAPSNSRSGRAYGITVSGDNFFGGAAGAQEYLMQIEGYKSVASTGDNYHGMLFIKGNNEAANDSNCSFRGLNCSVSNREDGTLGLITNTISLSLKQSSGNITTGIALQIDAQDLTAGTKATFGGLDVAINREGAAATEEFGIRVRTRGTIQSAVNTVFRIDKDATDHGFVNLFSIESDAVDYVACQGDVTVTTADKAIPIRLAGVLFYLIAVDGIPGV